MPPEWRPTAEGLGPGEPHPEGGATQGRNAQTNRGLRPGGRAQGEPHPEGGTAPEAGKEANQGEKRTDETEKRRSCNY